MDLPSLHPRVRSELLGALQQRATPAPKGAEPQLVPPLTATCWACAGWQDLTGCTSTGEACLAPIGAGRQTGRSAPRGDGSLSCFDLILGDGTLHEGGTSCLRTPPKRLGRHQRPPGGHDVEYHHMRPALPPIPQTR